MRFSKTGVTSKYKTITRYQDNPDSPWREAESLSSVGNGNVLRIALGNASELALFLLRLIFSSLAWRKGWRWRKSEVRRDNDDGGGKRMDSFIFPVDLAYISPPPEADTKTNGLSSRSCKTSPPRSLPHPRLAHPTVTCHRMQM